MFVAESLGGVSRPAVVCPSEWREGRLTALRPVREQAADLGAVWTAHARVVFFFSFWSCSGQKCFQVWRQCSLMSTRMPTLLTFYLRPDSYLPAH